MILARLFRPKWQHANPQVRRQALLKLSAQKPDEHAVLRDLAQNDSDIEVRKAAVKRVSDLAFLRCARCEDSDAGVREVAGARYRQLLAGGAEIADLQARLDELAGCSDDIVLTHVARRGREPELRLAALERLQAVAVLEEIAVHDNVPKLRQAAVSRLTDPAALERVMRQTRDRDRKVSRIARDALDRLQQEREAAERAQAERSAICDALDRLAATGAHEGALAERKRLENRWTAVSVPADPAMQQRFEELLQRCEESLKAPPKPVEPVVVAPAEQQRPEPAALLAALRQNVEPDAERLEQLRRDIAAAADQATDHDEASRRDLELLRAYAAAAERYLAQQRALQSAVDALATVDAADTRRFDKALQRLRSVEDGIEWPAVIAKPELLQRAAAALAEAGRRREQAAEQRAQLKTELKQLLDSLEENLVAGRLKESQRLLGRAHKLAEQLPPVDRENLDRRLKHDAGRVHELQDWRRFAILPKQAELCEQMEALIEADLPPPELAEQIHRLQEQWKATGGSGSAEGQQLWERFKAAGDKAFDRCRGYFDEQAQRREANLELRRGIVDQLERFVADADWERLGLTALEAIRGQARSEWQAAVPVDRRALKPLEARFEPLMETITGHIRAKQQDNRARKEALIERARKLVDADDPRQAAQDAKSLQNEWKSAGPAQPNVDRRLWREFRGACDQIFARRDQARGQADEEQQARVARAEALCVEAEALTSDEAKGLAELEARLAELRDEYQTLRPMPREQAQQFSQRLREVGRALDERRRQQARQREQRLLQAAEHRATLCAELEDAAVRGDGAASAGLEEQWQTAEQAPAPLQAALNARWVRAQAAAAGQKPFSADELSANLELRHELCLRMEILAGVESPAEDRARRMDVQVKRLADGMTAGRQSVAEQLQGLLVEWFGAGPGRPAEQAAGFEQRFWRARERIEG